MTAPRCACGSGEPRRALHDGYGIFMSFACDKCESSVMGSFRADIMERYETDEQIEPD